MTTNVFKNMLLIVSLMFISIANVKTAQNNNAPFNITRIAQPFSNDLSINLDIHGINPRSNILPNKYNSGIIPSPHPKYIVQNIGRVNVLAKTRYGTILGWIGDVSSYTILPGVRQQLENYGRPYYVTGVQIFNDQTTRAIVYVNGGFRNINNNPWAGFDKNKILKGAFALGVKFIPYVGNGLSALINAFWPENKLNVWQQIHHEIKTLLDNKIQQTIAAILDRDIIYMREKIKALERETRSNRTSSLARHYMNIAHDLFGFEKKFVFPANSPDYLITNFNILPHYTNVVTMKMNFFAIGIARPQLFQLSANQVDFVRRFAQATLYGSRSDGAIYYVRNMNRDVLDETYRTVYAGGLYNVMMNARSHIALHGLELIPVWEQALNNPSLNRHPYIDVVSYSNLFGRATPNLFQQATFPAVPEPLTPSLLNGGRRRQLLSIELFIWRIYGNGPARIGGLRLTFEQSRIFTLGTQTKEVQRLTLNGRTITRLRAFGSGAIDRLEFTLSDRSTIGFGTANNNIHVDFELKDHHIASLYLANDFSSLRGQAANIAVSFLQNLRR